MRYDSIIDSIGHTPLVRLRLSAANGVNPGETVVIAGFDRLEDGAKVSVREQGVPSPGSDSIQDPAPPAGQPASRGGLTTQNDTSPPQASPATRK